MSITRKDLIGYVGVTEEQLKVRVTEEHILEIALEMPSWEVYAPYLGLSSTDIDAIKDDYHKHEQRTRRCLEKWKEKASFKATYGTLVDVCLKLKNATLAERVAQIAIKVQGAGGGGAPTSGASVSGAGASGAGAGTSAPPKQDKLSEKPRLKELRTLKGKDGVRVSIIGAVAPEWRELGVVMDFDETGEMLDNLEANENLKKPEDRCQKMFQYWLAGNGMECTWANLIEMLEDIKKGHLAEQIKKILKEQ